MKQQTYFFVTNRQKTSVIIFQGYFLIAIQSLELTFANQMSTFLQKLEQSLKVQTPKEKFLDNPENDIQEPQAQFTTSKTKLHIQYKSPGVRSVSRVALRVNTQDLGKLQNFRHISNLGVNIAQFFVFLPKIKLSQQQSKVCKKRY